MMFDSSPQFIALLLIRSSDLVSRGSFGISSLHNKNWTEPQETAIIFLLTSAVTAVNIHDQRPSAEAPIMPKEIN